MVWDPFEELPDWCFACRQPAGIVVSRWIGHPKGSWLGFVRACAPHARLSAWSDVEESAFYARAARRLKPEHALVPPTYVVTSVRSLRFGAD